MKKKEKEQKIQDIIKHLENSLKESEEKLRLSQSLKENASELEKRLAEIEGINKNYVIQTTELQEKNKDLMANIANLQSEKNQFGKIINYL